MAGTVTWEYEQAEGTFRLASTGSRAFSFVVRPADDVQPDDEKRCCGEWLVVVDGDVRSRGSLEECLLLGNLLVAVLSNFEAPA